MDFAAAWEERSAGSRSEAPGANALALVGDPEAIAGLAARGPTRQVRLLGALALLLMHADACRGELRDDGAEGARELLASVELLAPVVKLPLGLSGELALFVAGGTEEERLLRLRAHGGRLSTRPAASSEPLVGFAVAPLAVWLPALVTGVLDGINAGGDAPALAGAIAGIAATTKLPGPRLAPASPAAQQMRAVGEAFHWAARVTQPGQRPR